MSDIAIIGDGAIGLSIAYSLIRENPDLKINIYGNGEHAASWAAGGMLNLYAEIEHKVTFENLINTERFEFAREAKFLWKDLADDLGLKINYGTYILNSTYGSTLDDLNINNIIEALIMDGVPFNDDNETPDGYNPVTRFRSKNMVYIDDEGWIDPLKLQDAYIKKLESAGVVFHNYEVQKLKVKNNKFYLESKCGEQEYDRVVIAAGAKSEKLFKQLKLKTPKILYGAGFGFTVYAPEIKLKHIVRSTNRNNACGITCIPRGNGYFYIGATSEIHDTDEITSPTISNVYFLFDQLCKEINQNFTKARITEQHFGYRPVSEDGIPLIGESSIPGLYIATGTRRDGLFMSPLIGQLMQYLILDGCNEFPETFKPCRKPHKQFTKKQLADLEAKYKEAYELTHRLG